MLYREMGRTDRYALSAEEIARTYGTKVAGVAMLPIAWVPAFIALPAWFYEEWLRRPKSFAQRVLLRSDLNLPRLLQQLKREADQQIIVRSSALSESLADSGRYASSVLAAGSNWKAFADAVVGVYSDYRTKNRQSSIGILVQVYVEPTLAGHLSNEVHLSPTRNQWKYEVEKPTYAPRRGINSKFATSPSIERAIRCTSLVMLNPAIRRVGHWINANFPGRTHLEWCVSNGYLWIVQLGFEEDDGVGVDPRIMPPLRATAASLPDVESLRTFQLYEIGTPTRWRKLSNIGDFQVERERSRHKLYLAEAGKVARALRRKKGGSNLASEISKLTNGRAVIRTDSTSPVVSSQNLPRTHTMSGGRAVKWLKRTLAALQSKKILLLDICFILHAYIPARAAAWSYLRCGEPIVEIDALWGLPDGLQFLPHDSFQVDIRGNRLVSEKVRFKPQSLQEQDDGTWKYVQIRRTLGRHRCLDKSALLHIARQTAAIAERVGADAQVMWFCDIPAELGIGQHLPWYRSREFASSSQEKRPPFRTYDVYGPKDLIRLQRLDTQRVIVRVMPEAELIRDDNFLDSLIKVVKQRSLPVELAGSILGHAYYKLKNAGLNVFSAEPYSAYYRTRGRKVFRKLVRDEIPEAIASKGERVIEARLSARESLRGLVAKLFEEGLEAVRAETRDELLEELADVFEVLRGMTHDVGFTLENVSQVADRKRAARGGFEKYRVLIETSFPRPSVVSDTPSGEGQITLMEVGSIEVEGGTIYVPFARLLADGHPIWIKVEVGGKIANVGICLEKAGVAVAIETDDSADRSRLRQLELDLDRQ